jgi:hypothetical protein
MLSPSLSISLSLSLSPRLQLVHRHIHPVDCRRTGGGWLCSAARTIGQPQNIAIVEIIEPPATVSIGMGFLFVSALPHFDLTVCVYV